MLVQTNGAETMSSDSGALGQGNEGSEVVLVVEDEASVRGPVSRALRSRGYYVLEASNGEDAINVLQDYGAPVHCVVTDIKMPEMTGTELAEMLRSWFPTLRMVFISAVPAEHAGLDVAAIGGAVFLQKPFGLGELADEVRRLLDSDWEPVG